MRVDHGPVGKRAAAGGVIDIDHQVTVACGIALHRTGHRIADPVGDFDGFTHGIALRQAGADGQRLAAAADLQRCRAGRAAGIGFHQREALHAAGHRGDQMLRRTGCPEIGLEIGNVGRNGLDVDVFAGQQPRRKQAFRGQRGHARAIGVQLYRHACRVGHQRRQRPAGQRGLEIGRGVGLGIAGDRRQVGQFGRLGECCRSGDHHILRIDNRRIDRGRAGRRRNRCGDVCRAVGQRIDHVAVGKAVERDRLADRGRRGRDHRSGVRQHRIARCGKARCGVGHRKAYRQRRSVDDRGLRRGCCGRCLDRGAIGGQHRLQVGQVCAAAAVGDGRGDVGGGVIDVAGNGQQRTDPVGVQFRHGQTLGGVDAFDDDASGGIGLDMVAVELCRGQLQLGAVQTADVDTDRGRHAGQIDRIARGHVAFDVQRAGAGQVEPGILPGADQTAADLRTVKRQRLAGGQRRQQHDPVVVGQCAKADRAVDHQPGKQGQIDIGGHIGQVGDVGQVSGVVVGQLDRAVARRRQVAKIKRDNLTRNRGHGLFGLQRQGRAIADQHGAGQIDQHRIGDARQIGALRKAAGHVDLAARSPGQDQLVGGGGIGQLARIDGDRLVGRQCAKRDRSGAVAELAGNNVQVGQIGQIDIGRDVRQVDRCIKRPGIVVIQHQRRCGPAIGDKHRNGLSAGLADFHQQRRFVELDR